MGIMDMFGKALGETMSAFGKEARTETVEHRFEGPISTLVVDAQSGNVSVEANADPNATHVDVVRTLHMFGEGRPELSEVVDGATLTLRAHAHDSMRTDRVDHTIVVPAAVAITVRTTAGNVSVSGTTMPVDVSSEAGSLILEHIDSTAHVRTNAGNVTLSHISGLVTATTQAGAVSATDIGGELTATSSAGSITARELRGGRVVARSQAGKVLISTAVRPDYVEADASVGAVQIEVPAGSYHVVTKVSLGSARVEGVAHDPESPNKICANSGAGSVKVVGVAIAT